MEKTGFSPDQYFTEEEFIKYIEESVTDEDIKQIFKDANLTKEPHQERTPIMIPKITIIDKNVTYVDLGDEAYFYSNESPIFKIIDDRIVEIYTQDNHNSATTNHINKFIDRYGYISLNRVNLFPLDKKERIKLIKEAYKEQ